MEIPGHKEATDKGFTHYSTRGDGQQASYVKDGIFLTVSNEGDVLRAELSAVSGLINLSTGKFSFPHSNFRIFEHQIRRVFALAEVALNQT